MQIKKLIKRIMDDESILDSQKALDKLITNTFNGTGTFFLLSRGETVNMVQRGRRGQAVWLITSSRHNTSHPRLGRRKAAKANSKQH